MDHVQEVRQFLPSLDDLLAPVVCHALPLVGEGTHPLQLLLGLCQGLLQRLDAAVCLAKVNLVPVQVVYDVVFRFCDDLLVGNRLALLDVVQALLPLGHQTGFLRRGPRRLHVDFLAETLGSRVELSHKQGHYFVCPGLLTGRELVQDPLDLVDFLLAAQEPHPR